MPKIFKNTMLQYLRNDNLMKDSLNVLRVFHVNNLPEKGDTVVYLAENELRAEDNFALEYAVQKSEKLNLPLKTIFVKKFFDYQAKQNFYERILNMTQIGFSQKKIDFETVEFENDIQILSLLKKYNPALVVIEFNPLRPKTPDYSFKTVEVDAGNIVPVRVLSAKAEYSAATIRPKIYRRISDFWDGKFVKNILNPDAKRDLSKFIENGLPCYARFKNNPIENAVSGLSKYLIFGVISVGNVAGHVISADVSDENKEAFLEELIVRSTLAKNFCFYDKKFKTLSAAPIWAQMSLNAHKYDIRTYLYDTKTFEEAKTHDDLWNACQRQLLTEGSIHGYMRMYWAKKIAEWSKTPEEALKTAICLNDRYAFDAPSANGYVGILWAITGLHDRPFPDFFVTGKIRRMTNSGLHKKFPVEKYIEKYR